MWTCTGPLPSLASRPNRKRSFSYAGNGLREGTLVISDGPETDEYGVEWCADEGGYLLAKQTGEAEVYCVNPSGCTCKGHRKWRTCKHWSAVTELLSEWRKVKISSGRLDTVNGVV
jgi:hypothetical protein